MKKSKIILGIFILVAGVAIALTSCKKDSSGPASTSFTTQQTEQLQNSDAQDALADKTEEDVDNNLDELENNNYSVSQAKSGLTDPTDTFIITVDHPDTTTFPKVVTLTYYNYTDSSADETIVKNGTISVTISLANPDHPKLITRSFVFTNFAVTTDSTTVILNGTRTVVRQKDSRRFNGLESARISVTDHITADLRYALVVTGSSDSLTFTRNVTKDRTAIAYFLNVNFKAGAWVYNLTHLRFRNLPSLDTLTYTGTVTGINEKGDTYTKTITSPLIITAYRGSLIVTAGTMTYADGNNNYTITFGQDPNHPHFTLVTITNETTGKTKSFDRRFGRIFKKWW
jgi:hypothetical protein